MKEYNTTVAYLNWIKGELAPKSMYNIYSSISTQYSNCSLHDFVRYHPWFIDVHTELLKELRSKPIPSVPTYMPFWGTGVSTTLTYPSNVASNHQYIITDYVDDYT